MRASAGVGCCAYRLRKSTSATSIERGSSSAQTSQSLDLIARQTASERRTLSSVADMDLSSFRKVQDAALIAVDAASDCSTGYLC